MGNEWRIRIYRRLRLRYKDVGGKAFGQMRHLTILTFSTKFLFLVLVTSSHLCNSQNPVGQQIDSVLTQRLADKTKQKESGTFVGQFKTYKKVLGLFKVRTNKGETYHEYIIYDNKLLKHREVKITTKHYGNDFQSEDYFYLDNKLVKYQRTINKRTKKGDYPKDKATFYVDNETVVSSDSKVEPWTLRYLQEQAKRDTEKRWD